MRDLNFNMAEEVTVTRTISWNHKMFIHTWEGRSRQSGVQSYPSCDVGQTGNRADMDTLILHKTKKHLWLLLPVSTHKQLRTSCQPATCPRQPLLRAHSCSLTGPPSPAQAGPALTAHLGAWPGAPRQDRCLLKARERGCCPSHSGDLFYNSEKNPVKINSFEFCTPTNF